MPLSGKIVLSASRRTDIPAFYMEWFMDRIVKKGHFEIVNPYNRKTSIIDAGPENIHTIVFWSKNFGPFLKKEYGERLLKKGYHLYFQFTINSQEMTLEANAPPLSHRLKQMESMSKRFHPKTINWRFDPICFYKKNGVLKNNLRDFPMIAENAAGCGVTRCVASFMDHYPKIVKRAARVGVEFFDPDMAQKVDIARRMEALLSNKGIKLSLCCEKSVLKALPPESGIEKSSCVPNNFFIREFGGDISTSPDRGQRIKYGCGCKTSVEAGVYHLHPCPHNCLFCYANPTSKRPKSAHPQSVHGDKNQLPGPYGGIQ